MKQNDLHKMYRIWCNRVPKNSPLAAELKNIEHQPAELEARFCQDLRFGTAGLRGLMGAGPNRMNEYTVARVTQGLAAYLPLSFSAPLRVAIGWDCRLQSEQFAKVAAQVLARSNIEVWMFPALCPTPFLSFAVPHLRCQMGIMITASHNPAEYNGYKVFDADGCQIGQTTADHIAKKMETVPYFSSGINFEQPELSGIKRIPPALETAFYEAVFASRLENTPLAPLSVAFTPIHGTGLMPVTAALNRAGYQKIHVVMQQAQPDGRFPTAPYPNPEYSEALQLGVDLLTRQNADILLATDPDADRIGVVVNTKTGPVHLNGNEVGVLLLDYICQRRLQTGRMPSGAIAVKSVVSTPMAEVIARGYGVELREVLTGFKHIAAQAVLLANTGERERFIFGFEESIGYMVGNYVFDKDAVGTAVMLCDLAAECKTRQETMVDLLETLYLRHGFFLSSLQTVCFEGLEGIAEMSRRMHALRTQNLKQLLGRQVLQTRDFLWDADIKGQNCSLPSSDVLRYHLDDETVICMRPSGTEPKLKLYCTVKMPTRVQAEQKLLEYSKQASHLLEQL